MSFGRSVLPDRNIHLLYHAVQRIGILRQCYEFARTVTEDNRVVPGDVLMHVSERDVGIGAFQPEGLSFERDAQNGVVGLAGGCEVGIHFPARRVDDRIVRIDSALLEHGEQVVRERLAVAEFGAEHLCGGRRLLAPDTELDADVTGRFSHVVVQRLYFVARRGQVVRAAVYLLLERVGKLVAPFEQAALPDSVRSPVAHAALRFLVYEVVRGRKRGGQQIEQRRPRRFGFQGRDVGQRPSVDVAAVCGALFRFPDVEALVTELGACRH